MSLSDRFRSGQIAMTGSALQLTALPAGTAVALKAHQLNATAVHLGFDNTVSATTGYELSPGETINIDFLNPSRLWIIGASGTRLSWAVVSAG